MSSVGYATIQIIPSFRGFDAAVNRHMATSSLAPSGQKAGKQLGDGVNDGFDRSTSKLSGKAKKLAIGVGAAMGVGAVAIAKWGLSVASQNEQAAISFEVLLGSAQEAQAYLGELQQFAASTPFEFPELRDAASRMIAVGTEATRVIPIMETLGDATSAMGTGSEGINRAVTALTQMQQKGKVTGEEMLQLAEAGIPAWDALASQMGVTVAQAQDMVTKGTVGVADIMAALENKAGPALERVTGMMDRQSQTLSGMLSTAKDLAAQGLATAFEPLVVTLKDLLPAAIEFGEDAMPKVAEGLEWALGAGEDFVAWARPLADQIASAVVPVLEDLADVAGDALPTSLGLAGGAVEGVVAVLTPLVDIVGVATGFLADHEAIVVAGAAAWAGYYAAVKGAGVWTAITGAVTGLSGAVGLLNVQITQLAGMAGVSKASAALGIFRTSAANLVGSISAVSVGFMGVAAAAAVMYQGINRAHSKAQRQIEDLKPADFDDRSTRSLLRYQEALGKAYIAAEENNAATSDFVAIVKGAGELLTPMENSIIDAAIAAGDLEKAYDLAADATDRWIRGTSTLAGELDMSQPTVERWIAKLDLDPKAMGWDATREAIEKASDAARNGTPQTDALGESYEVLADETSNSTEKLDAWKDALDAALGVPMGIFDAETGLASSLRDLTMELATNGSSMRDNTEDATANRQALSDAAGAVIDLAVAYGQGEGGIAAASLKLAEGREKLLAAGEAAGISREKMSAYLDELGLTPEFVQSQIDLNDPQNAKGYAEQLAATLNGMNGRTYSVTLAANLDNFLGSLPFGAAAGGRGPGSRMGNVFEYRMGGIGAGVYHGTLHKFAEPETGGEAYIPRLGSRDRSEGLLAHVASDWFGGTFVPAKRGGEKRSSRRRLYGNGGANVTVVARGASPAEVADELMWSMA